MGMNSNFVTGIDGIQKTKYKNITNAYLLTLFSENQNNTHLYYFFIVYRVHILWNKKSSKSDFFSFFLIDFGGHFDSLMYRFMNPC